METIIFRDPVFFLVHPVDTVCPGVGVLPGYQPASSLGARAASTEWFNTTGTGDLLTSQPRTIYQAMLLKALIYENLPMFDVSQHNPQTCPRATPSTRAPPRPSPGSPVTR